MLGVRFGPNSFDHICFKEPDKHTSERTVWKPARVERLLWIGHLLDNQRDCTTRLASWPDNRYIMYCETGDVSLPVYVVALDLVSYDHFDFVTAYPGSPQKKKELQLAGRLVKSSPHWAGQENVKRPPC